MHPKQSLSRPKALKIQSQKTFVRAGERRYGTRSTPLSISFNRKSKNSISKNHSSKSSINCSSRTRVVIVGAAAAILLPKDSEHWEGSTTGAKEEPVVGASRWICWSWRGVVTSQGVLTTCGFQVSVCVCVPDFVLRSCIYQAPIHKRCGSWANLGCPINLPAP